MDTIRSGPGERITTSRDSRRSDAWTVADLIDYEFLLNADECRVRETPAARQEIARRDRALYLEHEPAGDSAEAFHSAEHRRRVLLDWVNARRPGSSRETAGELPGGPFARGLRISTAGAILAGLVSGAGITAALLRYDGETPVNVAWYVFVLVLPQLALLLAAALLWIFRRSAAAGHAVEDLSWTIRLIRSMVVNLSRRLRHRVPQAAREDAGARKGVASSRSSLYRGVSVWTFVIPVQSFGVAFNLAAIVTTVALLWFTDRAFGWQSTLEVPDRTVYSIVRTIALPWRPIAGEGRGYPDAEQIAGSHIYLGEKRDAYDPADLRSWRWFLVLSVLFYGLLPRVIMLLVAAMAKRRALTRLSFRDARSQALYRRMVTPGLETPARGSGSGPEMAIPRDAAAPPPPPRTAGTPGRMGPSDCLLILHVDVEEIMEETDQARLTTLVENHTGWRVAARRTFGGGPARNREASSAVAEWQWLSPPPRVVVIDDGSQPPITEHLRFLKDLRAAAGTEADITLALAGEPAGTDALAAVTSRQMAQWRQKIDQLADPYLHLVSLTPPAAGT